MGYKITKFEVEFNGKSIPVAIHSVVDGDDINHIVSLDDYENFEIKADKNNIWKADGPLDITEELLTIITEKYKTEQS